MSRAWCKSTVQLGLLVALTITAARSAIASLETSSAGTWPATGRPQATPSSVGLDDKFILRYAYRVRQPAAELPQSGEFF